jgi:hypothetical protein
MSENESVAALQKVLSAKDLSYGAKCAYVALRGFILSGKDNPTLMDIANTIGCNMRHATRLMRDLREKNVIVVTCELRGRAVPNHYALVG